MGPAGGDAVGVDAVGSEFGGEGFGKGDDCALGCGIVSVANFSALTGGGRDENDVAACGLEGDTSGSFTRACGAWAGEHVGGGGMDEAEDTVDVGGLGEAPLRRGHGGYGRFDRRPDAVVGYEDVEVAEGFQGGGDEGFSIFGGGEVLLNRSAAFWATTFFGEGLSLVGGGAIAEGDSCSGLAEETYGGCSDAA